MDDEIEDLVEAGGVWTNGDPEPMARFPVPKGSAEFKIILPDASNRVGVPAPQQTPWRGIGLLNFFKNRNLVGVGSGFLCQPDVLVTAKHNLTAAVYDAAGVWLGFDGLTNPHTQPLKPMAFATHRQLDLAIFVLPGAHQGAFELGGPLPPTHAGVTIAGYSMPYENGAARFSFGIGPLVTPSGPNQLAYKINTREGDSGAPVFVVPGGVPQALGVHTEADALGLASNSGLHLTPAVVTDISRMIAWARGQIGGR